MNDKPISLAQFSQREIRLIEQLRKHPEIGDRLQSILELASNAEVPLKTADEVEELLIQEVCMLGNETMRHWATQAEERVSNEVKAQDATIPSRKKNAKMVVCLWLGECE